MPTDEVALCCYGVEVRLVDAAGLGLCRRLRDTLPPELVAPSEPPAATVAYVVTASVLPGTEEPTEYLVTCDGVTVFATAAEDEVYWWLRRDVEQAVARRSPRLLFVHAGVVGWRGLAIVIPGRPSTERSTLVAELVRRGAVYYSDAFAALDEAGRVHPYRRTIGLGVEGHPRDLRLVREDEPAEPLPLGLLVVGPYRPGVAWRPTVVRGARAVLPLVDSTVLARDEATRMLEIAARLAPTVVTLLGPRPEAAEVAAHLLDLVDDAFASHAIDAAGNGSGRLTDDLARVAEIRFRSQAARPASSSGPIGEPLARLPPSLQELVEWQRWSCRGRPVPPPHLVKVRVVKQYARRYRLNTLIETGTFQGAMVRALLPYVDRIYTVELDDRWHGLAREEFAASPKVTALHGDSGTVLRQVLATIDRPCLFWLDAHYSGSGTAKGSSTTPILQELVAILDHGTRGHVILIDDARDFLGSQDYPSLDQLRSVVLTADPRCRFEVKDDIVRITPTE